MYRVVKRDGKIADFNITKISDAITKDFDAIEKPYTQNIIDFLALKVTADFAPKVKEDLIAVEDVQDSVEEVLGQAGYADVAKAYILYRRNREKLRSMSNTVLDYKNVVDSYLKARQGEFHRHLFRRRTHSLQLRRYHRQLLAQRGL